MAVMSVLIASCQNSSTQDTSQSEASTEPLQPEFFEVIAVDNVNTHHATIHTKPDENSDVITDANGAVNRSPVYELKGGDDRWAKVTPLQLPGEPLHIGYMLRNQISAQDYLHIPDIKDLFTAQFFYPGSSGCGAEEVYTYRYDDDDAWVTMLDCSPGCQSDDEYTILWLGNYQNGLYVGSYAMRIGTISVLPDSTGLSAQPSADSPDSYDLHLGSDVARKGNYVDHVPDLSRVSKADILAAFRPLIERKERAINVIDFEQLQTGLQYDLVNHIEDLVSSNDDFEEDFDDYPDEATGTTYGASYGVDLGLSVNWADRNLDANSPTDMGLTVEYGATDGGHRPASVPDNISGTSYDVVVARMGNGWRMPTESEMMELIGRCQMVFTEVDGVKGALITGPSGNNIFLPQHSIGYRAGTENSAVRRQIEYARSQGMEVVSSGSPAILEVSRNRLKIGQGSPQFNIAVRPVHPR